MSANLSLPTTERSQDQIRDEMNGIPASPATEHGAAGGRVGESLSEETVRRPETR